MPAEELTWSPVEHRRSLQDFIDFPRAVHRSTHLMPRLQSQIRDVAKGTHPSLQHGAAALWLARDAAGVVRARTSIHHDDRVDARFGGRVQLFGFTDFVDDAAVFDSLTDHLDAQARLHGRTQLFGPFDLLPNQAGGVVTGGFEEPGFVDSAWNEPWVPGHYDRAGFERRFPAATWRCDDLGSPAFDPDVLFPLGPDDTGDDFVIRRADRRRLREQLDLMLTLLNASFQQLDYYTPITREELAYQTDGLEFLLDESLPMFVEYRGEPTAFALVVPDISSFIRQVDGNLHLGNRLRLLARRRQFRREAIAVIKGTRPDRQGHGHMRVMGHHMLRALRASGCETLRITWIETSNLASSTQFANGGGRVLHETCFYSKPVDDVAP